MKKYGFLLGWAGVLCAAAVVFACYFGCVPENVLAGPSEYILMRYDHNANEKVNVTFRRRASSSDPNGMISGISCNAVSDDNTSGNVTIVIRVRGLAASYPGFAAKWNVEVSAQDDEIVVTYTYWAPQSTIVNDMKVQIDDPYNSFYAWADIRYKSGVKVDYTSVDLEDAS